MNMQFVEHTLDLWIDDQSHILILGTIPSPKSREYHCYYGHPQNRFWKTLSTVFGEDIPTTPDLRREFAARHHIALWDVLASCDIRGAEDASISSPIANDIPTLLKTYPIRYVFTTGQKAKKLYDQLIRPSVNIDAIALPSTSPANRRWSSDEDLVNAYRIIASV